MLPRARFTAIYPGSLKKSTGVEGWPALPAACPRARQQEPTTADRDPESEDERRPRTMSGRLGRAATSGQGAAYEGAMEAILAILIAVGLGYWADQSFGSEPIGLIAGAVIGFAAFVLRLWRMNELVQQAAAEAETEPQRSVAARPQDRETILGAADRRSSGDDDRLTGTENEDGTDR